MEKSKKKKLCFRIFGIALLILGFLTAIYPFFMNYLKTNEANREIERFDSIVRSLGSNEQNSDNLPLSELYRVLSQYNADLLKNGQDIKGSAEFDDFGIDLTKYGLERDVIGVIEIPKIDIKLPLYLGADRPDMYRGAAVIAKTSAPIGGKGTNCVVAGHRGYVGMEIFNNIDKLIEGDKIYIRNPFGTLTYEVAYSKVTEKNDLSMIKIDENEDTLSLMSCHPYRINTKRLFVVCKRTVN